MVEQLRMKTEKAVMGKAWAKNKKKQIEMKRKKKIPNERGFGLNVHRMNGIM